MCSSLLRGRGSLDAFGVVDRGSSASFTGEVKKEEPGASPRACDNCPNERAFSGAGTPDEVLGRPAGDLGRRRPVDFRLDSPFLLVARGELSRPRLLDAPGVIERSRVVGKDDVELMGWGDTSSSKMTRAFS
ncbi:hypothetical protein ON010_g10080 [Phytophthora cinnamomi]|nr:hypothetical protein ON010_g10080 [Phytophthora cinnamomi]